MRVHALAPVVAVDLDGFLADYHRHFVWYLNNIYYPRGDYTPIWQDSFKGEFSDALGMGKEPYRDAKLAYRQGGLKRCIPQFDVDQLKGGIAQDIRFIRSLGVQVWITTNRPWMRLDNIDKDTQFWLDQNCGEVDGVLITQSKYEDLIDNVGYDRVLGVGDDLQENIVAARELGLRTALRRGDHNRYWWNSSFIPKDVRVVGTSYAFSHVVREWKEEWDANNPGVL